MNVSIHYKFIAFILLSLVNHGLIYASHIDINPETDDYSTKLQQESTSSRIGRSVSFNIEDRDDDQGDIEEAGIRAKSYKHMGFIDQMPDQHKTIRHNLTADEFVEGAKTRFITFFQWGRVVKDGCVIVLDTVQTLAITTATFCLGLSQMDGIGSQAKSSLQKVALVSGCIATSISIFKNAAASIFDAVYVKAKKLNDEYSQRLRAVQAA